MHRTGCHYQTLPVLGIVDCNRAGAVGGYTVAAGDYIFGKRHVGQSNVILSADQHRKVDACG